MPSCNCIHEWINFAPILVPYCQWPKFFAILGLFSSCIDIKTQAKSNQILPSFCYQIWNCFDICLLPNFDTVLISTIWSFKGIITVANIFSNINTRPNFNIVPKHEQNQTKSKKNVARVAEAASDFCSPLPTILVLLS